MSLSQYERSRQDRIKENQERMRKLGLLDLSSKLHSVSSAERGASTGGLKRKITRINPPSTPEGARRRSSRLQNGTPVSYSEDAHVKQKRSRSSRALIVWHEPGSRVEEYTSEDEKLLGNTTRTWDLFVDGVGNDGRRIYDSIKGKTCHQCRQKTLGKRTHCSSCEMVRGQFCGDCLYMRYGEHIIEALEDANWVCPVCRGICNCSFCRQAKGWPPTGALYRQVAALGYKSVAHYLVQTRRKVEEVVPKETPKSAKRLLPFEGKEIIELKDDGDVLSIEIMETPKEGLSVKVSKRGKKSVYNSEKSTEQKVELDTIGARLRQRRLSLASGGS